MAGGIITSASFAKSLWPGINKWYGKAYDEFPVEWDKLFEKNTSRRAFEEDVGYSGFGLASEKPEGESISYDSERQGFITRYTHVTYGLGFIVTREAVEDDLYDVVASRKAQGLAFSMRQTKEIVAANIYNDAFAGGATYGDGVSLLNSAHPNMAGGTWSNVLATAADLSEASLEQAAIDIQGFTNDRGLKIAVRPNKLVIPYQLEFEANRIFKSTGRVGTNHNDINAIKEAGLFPGGIVVSHYLTDPDAWYILTNASDGLKYWERRGDEFGMDNDFDTENAKYKATGRYSFGATDPRSIFGSPGA
jgi:phage major head subunit gpT-like protein